MLKEKMAWQVDERVLPAHEWMGLECEVVRSTDKSRVGLKGKIVDETKNTIIVETKSGEKTVPKAEVELEVFFGAKKIPELIRGMSSGIKEYKQAIKITNLFLKKNFGMPKAEPSGDAVLYPFVEASILKRWRYILVETGVRGNIQSFGFDRYELVGDSLEFSSRNKTVIVPAVFIKFGLFFPPW